MWLKAVDFYKELSMESLKMALLKYVEANDSLSLKQEILRWLSIKHFAVRLKSFSRINLRF